MTDLPHFQELSLNVLIRLPVTLEETKPIYRIGLVMGC